MTPPFYLSLRVVHVEGAQDSLRNFSDGWLKRVSSRVYLLVRLLELLAPLPRLQDSVIIHQDTYIIQRALPNDKEVSGISLFSFAAERGLTSPRVSGLFVVARSTACIVSHTSFDC